MLFSLIVPVYNTEKFLKDCLTSIEAQEFDDFEIILIDDGSTDSCPAMCDNFCEHFNSRPGRKSIAKVIHQENVGLSGARNRGIHEACGEWMWFVDSDDWIASDALAVLYERMRFAKGDLYAFQYIKTDELRENKEYIYFRANQEMLRFSDQRSVVEYFQTRLFDYKDGWEAPTRLFRREIIIKNNLRFSETDFNFGEDLCFMAEYMLCVRSAVMLVNYLYCYRQRESSIMHTLDQKTIIPRLIILLEDVFIEARRLNNKLMCERFELVCFAVFNHHIELKLGNLTDEEIRNELSEGEKNQLIGKYISKTSARLEQVICERHKS